MLTPLENRYHDDSGDYRLERPASSPLTVTHVVRTVSAYRYAIALAVLSIALGYAMVAIVLYLRAAAVSQTSLTFRLQFTGAENGAYPNGSRFSSADIIATPVLLQTFKENDLQRFTKFADYVSSVFVVESNEARETLAREYQARLLDARLTPIDRERIQREYDLKAGSLSKNQFSLNYARRRDDYVPDGVVTKVLHDILRNWVAHALNEQHVLEYRVAVMSPEIVASNPSGTGNPVVAVLSLRRNVTRLLQNMKEIRELPNAELIRSEKGLSLQDISLQLEDVIRDRLDPLVELIVAAGLDNRSETERFLASQLSYDEHILQGRIDTAGAAQRTLSMYMSTPAERETALAQRSVPGKASGTAAGSETVMPQLSDTFLDRLIQLTNQSADSDFRRRIADDYQEAMLTIVPAQQAVDYDRAALEIVRRRGGGQAADARQINAELQRTREDVRQLAMQVKELHKLISRNLNASTELLSIGTPETRRERDVSTARLILVGILLTLLTLAVAVLASLVHASLQASRRRPDLASETPSVS